MKNLDNDETKKLEELKREKLRKELGSEKSGDSNEKDEKKLDNDEKNSYIDNDEDSEDEVNSYKELLEKKFDGDPIKLAKSYKNSQSEFSKTNKKLSELEKQLKEKEEKLKEIEGNDTIKALLELGKELSKEDIERLKGNGKRASADDKPKKTNTAGKLKIGEDELAEAGFIDPSQKDAYTDSEWRSLLQEAKFAYLDDVYPDKVAEKAEERILEKQKEREKEQLREKSREEYLTRYVEGVKRVVDQYDVDFEGNDEHKKLLDEIDRRADLARDPDNPLVIDKEAVDVAAQIVLERNGIKRKQQDDRNTRNDNSFKSGFDVNNRNSGNSGKPSSVQEALKQRKLEEYKKTINKRKQQNRIK